MCAAGAPVWRTYGEEGHLTDSWIKVADEGAVPDGGVIMSSQYADST